MIEFAIVVPLLFILVASIVNFGLILYVDHSMEEGVRRAARALSTGHAGVEGVATTCDAITGTATFPASGSGSTTSAEKIACDRVSWSNAVYTVSASISGIDVNEDSSNDGDAAVVTMQANIRDFLFLPSGFGQLIGNGTLNASARYGMEGGV